MLSFSSALCIIAVEVNMAADGSKKSVIAAIAGNSVICVVKFIGFFVTGSGAMLSEAIHTGADLMNQWLLFLGIIKSSKAPDADFPFGYAKERFVWALISAVGIFFLGCGVTIYHGIHSLMDPSHDISDPMWAIAILLFSLVLEGIVLWVAAKDLLDQSRAKGIQFWLFCKEYADPSAVAVLLEDAAACLGVIIALTSLGLTTITGDTYWDGIGSITIGVLLGFVAIWLMQRNRELLVGQAIPQSRQTAIQSILHEQDSIEGVDEISTQMVDAKTYNVAIRADFSGEALVGQFNPFLTESFPKIKDGDFETFEKFTKEFAEKVVDEMAEEVERLEGQIRSAIPEVARVDIEPSTGE